MLQVVLDLIYPARCPVCKEIVIPKGRKICVPCESRLQVIHEPRCKKCSKPLEQDQIEYCSDCERKEYHFEYGYSLWIYDSVMKSSVSNFKYRHKKEYADYYVEMLVKHFGNAIAKMAPDAVVPVPVHKSKYRERGYNQAEILANGIGKRLGIPVMPDFLVRSKKTLPQKQLSDKERLKNLQEAFMVNKKAGCGLSMPAKVLLVDDIYTTGSTIEACTNVLLKHGVKHVYFITLCIGKGF